MTQGHCLPGLTVSQSQRVRELARQTLAERGFEAVVHANHLLLADGRQFGLDTLASRCHSSGFGEAAWDGVVRHFLTALLDKFPEAPKPLTPKQMRQGAILRLVPVDLMEPTIRETVTYAPRLGGGFAELLVHRDGDFVRFLHDADIARVDYAELRNLGMARLCKEHPDECELVRGNGAEVHVLRGHSCFVASQLLRLPEILRIAGGRRMRWPDGVLVAVPNRHELIFAPVDDSAVENLSAIAQISDYDYAHGHAPLVPTVHWWREGELTPLFDPTLPEGQALAVPSEFVDVLNRQNRDAA